MNTNEILETINMIDNEDLDVRTITMGISLLDCIDPDVEKATQKIYDKICRYAENLVKTGEEISRQYGIPIINKRISVTPIAMVSGACPELPRCVLPQRWTGPPKPWGSISSAVIPRWSRRVLALEIMR